MASPKIFLAFPAQTLNYVSETLKMSFRAFSRASFADDVSK